MQEILGSTSSEELISAMDSNMGAFWSCYGLADGGVLERSPALTWFYTGLQFSLFNGVPVINADEVGVKQAFEGLREQIAINPAPALWWIGPASRPDNIDSLLTGYGLELVGEVPAMAMDLDGLDETLDPIPGFTVERVDGADMQALWGRIAATGNGCDEAVTRHMEKIESSIDDPGYREQIRYIGYLDGKPVASTALVLDSGVAGIYAVATLPEARKKGIGKYLTVMPLRKAREQGYRVAILQSSSAGYSIYQRIGFKELFRYRLFLQQ